MKSAVFYCVLFLALSLAIPEGTLIFWAKLNQVMTIFTNGIELITFQSE